MAAAALALATHASAMSVSWNAQVSRFLTLSDQATLVPQGDLIEIGITSASQATLNSATTATQLAANFTIVAAGFVGDTVGLPGTFAESTATPGAGFFSKQIYLLAFNANAPAGATQAGVFTDTSWLFPPTDTAGTSIIDLGDSGVTAQVGSLASGTVVGSGLDGTDAGALKGGYTVVPEPSSIVLVALGLLGGLGVIRRRK